ncbi:MAG: DivIVA domain-containing protein, partial [Firmicutes bacterium]|nr:DivIVA domain-containing protein [Candidatus Colimorpha enterica]
MLAPHELKNKDFTKSLRGYSTEEVDEHIAFIIEKYTELYKENDELEKKLRMTEARLDEIKAEEDSIRAVLINAQKASKTIIDDANEQADVIMRSAKTNCDRLIAELRINVEKENEKLEAVKNEIKAFKASLYEGYRNHIEMIENIAPETDGAVVSAERAEELTQIVVGRIKNDLDKMNPVITGKDAPYEDENESDTDVTVPSEVIIPDNIYEADAPKVVAVRDADQISFDEVEEDEPEEEEKADDTEYKFFDSEEKKADEGREVIDSEGGKSLVDSIKKLNNEVNKNTRDEDEEFLKMLRAASGKGDMTSTEAFEEAY